MVRQYFFGKEGIRSIVMKRINEKIDAAEKQYQADCEEVEREAEEKKHTLMEKHVDSIIGRVI